MSFLYNTACTLSSYTVTAASCAGTMWNGATTTIGNKRAEWKQRRDIIAARTFEEYEIRQMKTNGIESTTTRPVNDEDMIELKKSFYVIESRDVWFGPLPINDETLEKIDANVSDMVNDWVALTPIIQA